MQNFDSNGNSSETLGKVLEGDATVSEEGATVSEEGGSGGFPGKTVIIPLYSLIFLLSVVGNLLVIFTLAKNRRMVTVTNVFLLNLVS